MHQIRRFEYINNELYSISLAIRRKVFIEEQEVPEEIEIEFEDEAHYYLLYLDEQVVATARWRTTSHGIKLERFAMLKEYRNKGYGSVLLENIMNDVNGYDKRIYLHAQLAAVNYYSRYGFRKEGEVFEEAGIAHFLMVLF